MSGFGHYVSEPVNTADPVIRNAALQSALEDYVKQIEPSGDSLLNVFSVAVGVSGWSEFNFRSNQDAEYGQVSILCNAEEGLFLGGYGPSHSTLASVLISPSVGSIDLRTNAELNINVDSDGLTKLGSPMLFDTVAEQWRDIVLQNGLLVIGGVQPYQPLDSNLTAIAALTTTSFGRGLLTESSASTAKTTLGLNNVENAAASGLYVGLTGAQTVAGAKTFTSDVTISKTTPILSLSASSTTIYHGIEFLIGSTFDASIKHQANSGTLQTKVGRSVGWAGKLLWTIDTVDAFRMDGTSFYPDVTNTATSGLSSKRWANVYSVLGNFSGDVNVIGGDYVQGTGGYLHRLNGNNSALGLCGGLDINNAASIQLRGGSVGSNNNTVIFRRGTGSSTVDTFTIDGTTSAATFTGNIQPSVTNTPTNGTSSLRWANVYSVLGNFSGAVTASSTLDVTGLVSVGVYTFATVPSASANSGKVLRISDRSQKHAYSDGTNWRFFDGSVIIS